MGALPGYKYFVPTALFPTDSIRGLARPANLLNLKCEFQAE